MIKCGLEKELIEIQDKEQVVRILIDIVRSVILDKPSDIDLETLSGQQVLDVLELAKEQSLLSMAASKLEKYCSHYNEKINRFIMDSTFSALYQYESLEYETKSICEVLDRNQIDYIKLKGARIRQYYPQPWMRASGDIDILVRERDIRKAAKMIREELGYHQEKDNYHDIPMYSPSGVFLELHFNITEHISTMDKVLKTVWNNSIPINDQNHEYIQTNEFFIFHQITHMAYHFMSGGCGIRPIIDIYLLRNKLSFDEKKVRYFCREAQLETLYDCILELMEVWFEGKEMDNISRMLENFIIEGGTFGNQMNQIAVQENQAGSNLKYIFSRIFWSYDQLKTSYPILNKYKWMMPFCEIHRWTKALGTNRKKYIKEIQTSRSLNKEYVSTVGKLLDELGLK